MRDRLPAPLLVLGAAVLWGTTGTTQALAPRGTNPLAVGVLRTAVGAACLLAATAVSGRASDPRRWWRQAPAPLAITAAAIAIYQLAFFAGVSLTGVAVGTLVGIGTSPVVAGIIDAATGRPPDRRWLAGTAVTLVGASVLLLGGGTGPVDPVGVVLAATAGAAYAAYTAASKRVLEQGAEPTAAMAAGWAGGAVLLLPALGWAPLGWVASVSGATTVLWLGAVTVGVAYVWYGAGLRRLSAATVASLTLAEPLTAALLGVLVVGERLSGAALAGCATLAAGLVVLSVPARRPLALG